MSGSVGRAIGLDVHRDFCEVAICEAGRCARRGGSRRRRSGWSCSRQSLGRGDRVALEVTGGAWEIARILEPHVRRVIVVSPDDTGIRQARAKTDRLDARTLAKLLAAGELDAVWMPDECCRVMRRRLARREQLVRSRSRVEERDPRGADAPVEGPPAGVGPVRGQGTQVAGELELPLEEAETVAGAHAPHRVPRRRDRRGRAADRPRRRCARADARRLMTVPGVNVICAATFLAAIGDIRRFRERRGSWSPISGLTRASASPAASPPAAGGSPSGARRRRAGRWSRRPGASSGQPGPLHAFYERIRARRGHGKAVVACGAQARDPVLVPAHPRRGLRPPAAVADRQEAAAARDHAPAPRR